MLPIIAWRNIWRNPTRSLVLIGALVAGIWSLIFVVGFIQGMVLSYVERAIETRTSHIQVHHPAFKDDNEIGYTIPDMAGWTDLLERDGGVEAYSPRTIVSGMLSASRGTAGVMLQGIDPVREAATIGLDGMVTGGEYLTDDMLQPLLLSEKSAAKLKVQQRQKVVFQFQGADGELTAAAFRVAGFFATGNAQADAGTAYVLRSDLNRVAGLDSAEAHRIAVLLGDFSRIDTVQKTWSAAMPEALVETYSQLSPELDLYQNQIKVNMVIMTIIFMLALVFGIINTMLMAVLERVRELGMLMAIGMNRWRVFVMILLETLGVALIAAPIGLLLGWRTMAWLGRVGLDLSVYGKGLEQFGMDTMVYPALEGAVYAQILVAVVVTALIGALYPAWKAIRLRPVEALRKI